MSVDDIGNRNVRSNGGSEGTRWGKRTSVDSTTVENTAVSTRTVPHKQAWGSNGGGFSVTHVCTYVRMYVCDGCDVCNECKVCLYVM